MTAWAVCVQPWDGHVTAQRSDDSRKEACRGQLSLHTQCVHTLLSVMTGECSLIVIQDDSTLSPKAVNQAERHRPNPLGIMLAAQLQLLITHEAWDVPNTQKPTLQHHGQWGWPSGRNSSPFPSLWCTFSWSALGRAPPPAYFSLKNTPHLRNLILPQTRSTCEPCSSQNPGIRIMYMSEIDILRFDYCL